MTPTQEAQSNRENNALQARENDMKRILVIGATSGIGRALVEEGRKRGYEMIAAGRRQALLEEIGGETLLLDVTADDALARIEAVHADTVIFNAGFGIHSRLLSWDFTETALQLNVIAFEKVAQWAYTHCETFVATASIAGLRGLENTNGYAPSKAYMINAMEGYRRKSRHEKGRCHYITLLPGFVDTAMGQASRFWRCSTKEAAFVIIKGLERRQSVIYVTRRWALIAFLLRHLLPRWLFERIKLHI
jgi:short-subunit dehydrogenase